jgi:hypothetical protein
MTKDRLPAIVRAFAERNAWEGPLPPVTRVSQRGRMWRTPGSRPLEFTAVAAYGVRQVEFSWRAKFPIAGRIAWLSIVDAYGNTGGRMDGRVWGLVPFMRTRGVDVEVGEVSRYLSELPWAPHSILGNLQLEWREVGDHAVSVGTSLGPRPVSVTFRFDGAGDIMSCFMSDRPRQVGRRAIATSWRGRFDDYVAFEHGLRMPRRGKVWWELPDGPFVYWEGEIEAAVEGS